MCSTFFILITQVPLWQSKLDLLQNIQHNSVVITMDSNPKVVRSRPEGNLWHYSLVENPLHMYFLGDANVMFCPKNHEPNFCYNITISLEVESTTFVSPEAPLQYWCVGVLQLSWFFVKIEATDNRSNFAETILFENCSCFSKIPYSISVESPRSVSHFDFRRSLSLANRRPSTSPNLFVSFTQSCDQHDRKVQTIRKSAAPWRRRRARL